MDVVSADWSNRHKELNKVIRKTESFAKGIEMILELHKELHTSVVSESKDKMRWELKAEKSLKV